MLKFWLTNILLVSVIASVKADNWMRDSQPSILEVYYIRTEVIDTTQGDKNFFKEQTMLRIGESMSWYCSEPRFNRDSLMFNNPDLYWQLEAALFDKNPKERDMALLERSGRYSSFIFKNYPVGKVTETDRFNMDVWVYEEDWEKPEWEFIDESKVIMGYQCFKAVSDYRGRRWTAWFTPEIPVQEGPWKLCDLPGLILEAEDNHKEYHFIVNGLKQQGIAEVGYLCYREKRGIRKVSRDKFFNNWWRYANSNFGARMAALYGKGSRPGEIERKTQHRDREETNYPHEL